MFRDKWNSKYPKIYKSWHDNWANISIQYSIPIIKELAEKEHEKYIPFNQLKALLRHDVEQTKEEFDSIRNLIVRRQEHDSPFLIIMYHIPQSKMAFA